MALRRVGLAAFTAASMAGAEPAAMSAGTDGHGRPFDAVPLEVMVGVCAPADEKTRWQKAGEAYLSQVFTLGSPRTHEQYRYTLLPFLAAHPDPSLLTPIDVQLWAFRPNRFRRPASAHLIRARLAVVAGYYRWCQRAGLLETNPADVISVQRPRPKRKQPKEVRASLVRELLAVMPDSIGGLKARAFVLIGVFTGLRRAEILELTRGSMELRDGRWFWTVRTKGGHIDCGEMPLPAMEAIWTLLAKEGREWSRLRGRDRLIQWAYHSAWKRLKAYSEKAGHSISPHDLRRASAQLLEDVGADPREIQARLRLTSLQTLERHYLPLLQKRENPRWPDMAEALGLPGASDQRG